MSTIAKPNTFTAGTIAVAARVNANFDTIYNDYNGNISNANIKSDAAILGTKLNLESVGSIGTTSPGIGVFTSLTANAFYGSEISAGNATINVLSIASGMTANGISSSDIKTSTFSASLGTINTLSSVNISALGLIIGNTLEALLELNAGTPSANTIYSDNIVKAWLSFGGSGSVAERQSFNVSSITDIGTGQYSIAWDRDFATVNYSCVGSASDERGYSRVVVFGATSYVGASVDIFIRDDNNDLQDEPIINLIALGSQ